MDTIAQDMGIGQIMTSVKIARRCLEALDGLAVLLVDASAESADLDGIAAIIETNSALAEQQLAYIADVCRGLDARIAALQAQRKSNHE